MTYLKVAVSFSALSIALLYATHGQAQQTPQKPIEEETVDLGNIEVVETGDNNLTPAYESFDPIDSGTTVIGRKSIALEKSGDIDTTQLLKKIPHVQMDTGRGTGVTKSNVQDIRPSDFAISGGDYYNNNIMIDGVQANSILDATADNPAAINDVAGQRAQTVYIDPSLIETITVRDSNISSEFGDFTGGVVEINLRKPAKKFGVSVSGGLQTDDSVHYRVASENMPDDPADLPAAPVFRKDRLSIAVDVPVNDKLALLASYARSTSSVIYEKSAKYGGGEFESGDTSENYLLKGVYDISDALVFESQIAYSPYDSDYENANSLRNRVTSQSDGLATYAKLNGTHNDIDWQTRIAFSRSDTSRQAPDTNFSWSSASTYSDWCANSSCSEGGFGKLDQKQDDLTLDFKLSKSILEGLFRLGGEHRSIDASKQRLEDGFYFRNSTVSSMISCTADDIACKENDIILTQRNALNAYDINVNVKSQALWAEYERDFGTLSVRGGVRYSHENFLDNSNIAPRLSTSFEVVPDWFITAGANRYYGKNMVAYAIRSQMPDTIIHRRTTTADGNGVLSANDWTLYRHTRSSDYAQADLDTPYSDELTLALTAPTFFDGTFRLKGVKRKSRDQFARSPREVTTFDAPTATSTRQSLYTITNDGGIDYKGLSAEWLGHIGRHSLAANFTWSDTNNVGAIGDYFDTIDLEDLASEQLYYDGEVITEEELNEINLRANFATPITGSFIWSTTWLQDRLTTSASAYYRGAYEQIQDTRENITIEGTRYDVFGIVETPAHVNVSLNSQFEVFENAAGQGVLELRIDNVLDNLPHTYVSNTNPYQKGRSVWLGFTYKY